MNQRYHVVFKKGTVTVRRPWKGKGEELYSSSGDPKRNIPAMFGLHEKRQFLEQLGPFVIASIDDPAIARNVLADGLPITDPDTGAKSKWFVAGYYVRDDGAVYVMLPKRVSDADYYHQLGMRVDLENKWGNSFKVGKYMKRLYSHHRRFLQGTVVDDLGPVITVRLENGKQISVKYADHGKLTDGMNLVSSHCMKMMGLRPKAGAGLRITALSPKGFSKGHAIVMPDLRHDLVMFNSKKLLYGDKFTFACDWLHSGNLFTDIQSVMNFRFYDQPFLFDWSKLFMEQVIEAIQDEEKLRNMLRFYSVEFHQNSNLEEEDENYGEFIEKDKDWALLRALRGGIGHKTHPALVRKIFHLFADKVMDCFDKIRIPVPAEVGGARYAMVDPTIFDVWGDPVLDGQLRDNEVYCAHNGEVAFHRQPNAHRGEHHVAKAVPNLFLEQWDTGCFMFLSKDIVQPALDKLGGGDQDDRLVYYKDKTVVNHFKSLEPYPIVNTVERLGPKVRENVFAHLKLRQPTYDRTQLLIMLDQLKKQSVNIGYVVNAVMLDTLLTDQKSNIINYMASKMPLNTAKQVAAFEWIKNYSGNTLRVPASRLEVVIDGVKKEGSDLRDIGDEIKKFNSEFMVIPEFCISGGKYGGRVPQSRRNETHPVNVRCTVDDVLDSIRAMRNDLEDIVNDISWQMLEPVPLEVLTQPTAEGAEQLAVAIRSFYRMQWANLNAEIQPTNDKEEKRKRIDAYIKIDESLAKTFGNHPLIVDAMVHLYTMIYDNRQPEAPVDENGRAKSYPDGLLWGPRMSAYTMRMLELVGLAGRYVHAELIDPKHNKLNVDVKIDGGVITQLGTNEVIGTVDQMADGANKVERGFVKVQARDAYPYNPKKRIMSLTVVDGLKEKNASKSDIMQWQSHVHEKALLIPYIRGEEHAVRVVVEEGNQTRLHGHLAKEDTIYVTQKTSGWLVPGKSERTMEVLIEE